MRVRKTSLGVAIVVALCQWIPGRLLTGSTGLEAWAAAIPPVPPAFTPDVPSQALASQLRQKGFAFDTPTGNYLAPKVSSKARPEPLVPVLIGGEFVRDLRGRPVFLRQSIRDRLSRADDAMFKAKGRHVVVNYGFRSNALQAELYEKIAGKGKVAGVGRSFHEGGLALDVSNWHDAQRFMIEAGFVGGCYGIEEDMVHYSVDEISKASNAEAFKRCTLKELPDLVVKGTKQATQASKSMFGKLKKGQ